ncbi:MAG TPA: cell wall-binding repeat-containing protein [Acidimicrobiales bacterium]|nr:cell wall-binding repeat-containing protein [Acidimicrobiales bacterium]
MTTIPKLRRLAVAILAAATATAGLLPLGSAPAGAVAGFTWERLAGADRFDTARRIAVETFGSANTVLLARADIFPDALSGSYLAGSTDTGAPILLSEVNRIPQATNEALATLGTERVILLGGPNAISSNVEQELRNRNFDVERIGGRDRFETSQQIAERLGSSNVGQVDNNRTAIVGSGRNFPDVLAGGPLSFANRLPAILTDTNSLPQPARNALTNLGIERVFLLGGPAAVSANVENQLRDMGITVERLGGANRQDTAVIIAETAFNRLGFDETHVNLARGDHFADALSGGPHAGDESNGGSEPGSAPAPIVLALSPTVLSIETSDFLTEHSNTLRDGHIFGGTAAVSDAVADEAARAAGAGRAAVQLDNESVEQGGVVTGSVAGDPQRVFVSGCGLNERELTRNSQGRFSLTIPDTQPVGQCTLSFRMTFADGSEEVDSFGITITAPLRASTAAPELVSVSFVRRFTQPNTAGGVPFEQSVIRFTFDEAVTGQALISADSVQNSCTEATPGCSAKFKLYRFDQTPDSTTNPNPNRIYTGRNAQIDPNDTKSVLVTFGQSRAPGSTVERDIGTAELLQITLGAVEQNAVRDGSNVANPYGDAGLNSLVFEPGTTVAPDLVDVTNFRPNFDTTRTLVDFVFDEPAIPSAAARTAGGGYFLVLNDADVSERSCDFQAGPTGSTTNGSGTTTHTVSCQIVGLTQLTAADVARGGVSTSTVTSGTSRTSPATPDTATDNPLQTHDITNEGATSRPDLVSAEFFDGRVDGTTATFDQVLYTFDEPVLVSADCGGPCFRIYRADGNEVRGDAFRNAQGNPVAPVRSTTNDTQVIVTFPDGAINDSTGASVTEGAVQEAIGTGGINRINRDDEVDVQGVTFAAGLTTGPDLIACELEVTQRDPISGNATAFRLVFAFDEDVRGGSGATPADAGPGPDPARFFVYDANGEYIAPRTAGGAASGSSTPVRGGASAENRVILTGYANQADLRNVAACAVADSAVVDEDTASPNPIGYEVIS